MKRFLYVINCSVLACFGVRLHCVQEQHAGKIPEKPVSAHQVHKTQKHDASMHSAASQMVAGEKDRLLKDLLALYKKEWSAYCNSCVLAQREQDSARLQELVYKLSHSAVKLSETFEDIVAVYRRLGVQAKTLNELRTRMQRDMYQWASLTATSGGISHQGE